MATVFERIKGDDKIFDNKEYISDSLMFNSIETARTEGNYDMYSDHKSVIVLIEKKGNKVWLWTSSTIKEDTNKLIDICRFLRECDVPRAEIYLKQDVSGTFSDLYALATLEINYVVKDEFSMAVYTFSGNKTASAAELGEGEEIIRIDRNNEKHRAMVREYYETLKDEFRWQEKFERKLEEYLNTELYVLVKDGKIIANAALAGSTEHYIRIKSIAVREDMRRRGYGYKMAAYAVGLIRDRSLTPVLYSHVGNTSAVALWSKAGFKAKDKLYLLKIENQE